LPKSKNNSKTDLELLFKKLQFEDQSSIGLISFFSAFKLLAQRNEIDVVALADQVQSSMEA